MAHPEYATHPPVKPKNCDVLYSVYTTQQAVCDKVGYFDPPCLETSNFARGTDKQRYYTDTRFHAIY